MNGIPLSSATTPIINFNHSEHQDARFGDQTLHEMRIIGVDKKHLHIEVEALFSETIFRKYSTMAGSRCGA